LLLQCKVLLAANACIARISVWLLCRACSGMLAPDGRCKTLDVAADGYVRAEACVVLRLDAANADEPDLAPGAGDGLCALLLLKGTFVNQVGGAFKTLLQLQLVKPLRSTLYPYLPGYPYLTGFACS
jgi:hypothetical protein